MALRDASASKNPISGIYMIMSAYWYVNSKQLVLMISNGGALDC